MADLRLQLARNADEYPLADIPATPLWGENYAFSCFDPVHEVAVIAMLGRWWADPRIWREFVMISLSGDSVIVAKNYGQATTSDVASAALFRVEVTEPGRSLRLRFDGPASIYSRAELLAQGATPRRAKLVRADIDFRGVAPVWNMSGHEEHGETIAGSLHLEQVGTGHGFVEFGDERRAIEHAFMNRDHSRGVRDLTPFRRHCWAQGWFPAEDVTFNVYAIEVFGVDGLAMQTATVSHGDQRYPAEIVAVELIEGLHDMMGAFRLTLRSELGEMSLLNPGADRSLPVGVTSPWEVFAGATPGQHNMMTFEEPVRWDWDGRSGLGWSERAFNAAPFGQPAS